MPMGRAERRFPQPARSVVLHRVVPRGARQLQNRLQRESSDVDAMDVSSGPARSYGGWLRGDRSALGRRGAPVRIRPTRPIESGTLNDAVRAARFGVHTLPTPWSSDPSQLPL